MTARRRTPAMPPPSFAAIAGPGPSVADLSDARLLVVDDDPAWIDWVAHALAGFKQMRFATDSRAALVQVLAWPPELVLLDAEMPGLDGFEVCQALRNGRVDADTPIIFVTRHTEEAVESAVFAVGGSDFVTKPVSAATLRVRVALHLRLRRLARLLGRC